MPVLKAIRKLFSSRQMKRDLVRCLRKITKLEMESGVLTWRADQLNNWPGYNVLLDAFVWKCDGFIYRLAEWRGKPILGVFHETQGVRRSLPQSLFCLQNRDFGMTLLFKEVREAIEKREDFPFSGRPNYEDREELQRTVFGICSPGDRRVFAPHFFLHPA